MQNSKIDNNSSNVKAQSGAQNYTLEKFSNQVETIVFPEPFDEIPEVTATMVRLDWTSSSYDDYFTCTVSTVTKTEFTVIMTSNIDSSTDVNVVWEAKTGNSNIGNAFSTEEVKTNDVWIDGKPIYRKVVNCGALPNSTTKEVSHGVSNIDVIMADSSHSYATDGSNFIPLPFVHPTSASSVKVTVTRTIISIQPAQDRSNFKNSFVTILYTKTTD